MMKNKSREELEKDAQIISDALSENVDADISEEVVSKIALLASLTALSAEIVAQSKKQLDLMELQSLARHEKSNFAPSVLTKYIKAETADATAFYTYCDRLNAGITHSIDGLRSILSLRKIEMQNQL